jgi:hypothetical protein
MKTASKSEIFTWLYQTVNMPIVLRFAYWLKKCQKTLKSDENWHICEKLWFLGLIY